MVQIHPPLPFNIGNSTVFKLRKIFEHTADAGITAEGSTLSEAFNEVSLAFTEIITGGKIPDSKINFDVMLESNSLDSLLVNYLSHLIFLFDTEDFLVSKTKYMLDFFFSISSKTKPNFLLFLGSIAAEYIPRISPVSKDFIAVNNCI